MKPYRPSNGTDGDWFQDDWCSKCHFEHGKKQCKTLNLTMFFDTNDKEYPKEWVYKDGNPVCLKYRPYKPPCLKADYQDDKQRGLF